MRSDSGLTLIDAVAGLAALALVTAGIGTIAQVCARSSRHVSQSVDIARARAVAQRVLEVAARNAPTPEDASAGDTVRRSWRCAPATPGPSVACALALEPGARGFMVRFTRAGDIESQGTLRGVQTARFIDRRTRGTETIAIALEAGLPNGTAVTLAEAIGAPVTESQDDSAAPREPDYGSAGQ